MRKMSVYKNKDGSYSYILERDVVVGVGENGEVEGKTEIELQEAELEEMLEEIKREKRKG